MFKRLILAILLGVFTFQTNGQTNRVSVLTNWGNSVYGTQLSISLSNSVIAAGTNAILKCWVKNSSTNLVKAPTWTPEKNFHAILTNSSGGVYELTPDPDKVLFRSQMGGSIGAGETRAYEIILDFSADIKPGIYKLFVKRRIGVDNKWYDLLSNVLDIQMTSKASSTKAPAQ